MLTVLNICVFQLKKKRSSEFNNQIVMFSTIPFASSICFPLFYKVPTSFSKGGELVQCLTSLQQIKPSQRYHGCRASLLPESLVYTQGAWYFALGCWHFDSISLHLPRKHTGIPGPSWLFFRGSSINSSPPWHQKQPCGGWRVGGNRAVARLAFPSLPLGLSAPVCNDVWLSAVLPRDSPANVGTAGVCFRLKGRSTVVNNFHP